MCLAKSSTSNRPGQEPAEDLNRRQRREQRGAWQQSRSGDLLSPPRPKRFPKPLQMQSDRTGTKLRTFVTVSAGTKRLASAFADNSPAPRLRGWEKVLLMSIRVPYQGRKKRSI